MKKAIIFGCGGIVLLVILFFGIPILTSLNTKAGTYDYADELSRPGMGVNITNDSIQMRAFIAWNKFYNNIASSLWNAPDGVKKSKLNVQTRDREEIGGYILEPEEAADGIKATMLYCHGGAFYMPILPASLDCAAYYAQELQCRVYMPEYRLTPSNPYPVSLNDCYDTLQYISDETGVDLDKVILYGESAGGCLCAEVMNMCLDEKLLKPAAQMLIYPVTDDSQEYESLDKYAYTTWTTSANQNMWELYLDGREASELPYAVPMLREDFSDFPPVYIEPAEMDALCDQDIAYAQKLRDNGVNVTEKVIKGAYHGFDGDVQNPFIKNILDERVKWLSDRI